MKIDILNNSVHKIKENIFQVQIQLLKVAK